ncbi:MAG: adenosylcobinamide-GDP ribazoletransferase [Aquihabitans sp.]
MSAPPDPSSEPDHVRGQDQSGDDIGSIGWLGDALGAAQFLTRVPIHTSRAAGRAAIVPWFPVVGALVGLVVAGVAVGLDALIAPFPAAATAVMVGVIVTGAFHEDGLADSADAIAGGTTRERRYEILADSRLGTYGTAAVCGTILVRVSTVATLVVVGGPATVGAVVAAHALARGAGVSLMAAVEPVREAKGLGQSFGNLVSTRRATGTVVVAVVIAVVAVGWWAAPMLVAAGLAALLVARLARTSFGGVNGDHLGAAEQLAEIAGLLTACALAVQHPIWWG